MLDEIKNEITNARDIAAAVIDGFELRLHDHKVTAADAGYMVQRCDALLARLDAMKPGDQAEWLRSYPAADPRPFIRAALALDLLAEENAEMKERLRLYDAAVDLLADAGLAHPEPASEAARLALLAHNEQMKRDVTPY